MGAFEESRMTARPGASKVSVTNNVRHGNALLSKDARERYPLMPHVGPTRGGKHPRAQKGRANEEDREKTKMLQKKQDHVAGIKHGARAPAILNDLVRICSNMIKCLGVCVYVDSTQRSDKFLTKKLVVGWPCWEEGPWRNSLTVLRHLGEQPEPSSFLKSDLDLPREQELLSELPDTNMREFWTRAELWIVHGELCEICWRPFVTTALCWQLSCTCTETDRDPFKDGQEIVGRSMWSVRKVGLLEARMLINRKPEQQQDSSVHTFDANNRSYELDLRRSARVDCESRRFVDEYPQASSSDSSMHSVLECKFETLRVPRLPGPESTSTDSCPQHQTSFFQIRAVKAATRMTRGDGKEETRKESVYQGQKRGLAMFVVWLMHAKTLDWCGEIRRFDTGSSRRCLMGVGAEVYGSWLRKGPISGLIVGSGE
ncbi:hypothetical protein PAXRUDRAFT_26527 [Paxillus rubicundulus Ve08.2h10]|uniref:Uncharacterized protein n=1 Tax=Paxillus rubicundulus Ve08.2h10 TaxID=930991 RepID=A0A0D0DMR5_9AGAM|nr:hypothetical protein PAXRUDRAFT_26527 [Paxillus rubicundulus Ve08.2h10]